jgi:hypothetical protein
MVNAESARDRLIELLDRMKAEGVDPAKAQVVTLSAFIVISHNMGFTIEGMVKSLRTSAESYERMAKDHPPETATMQ